MRGSITMRKKFITREHIIQIINHYGGLSKYELNSHIKDDDYGKIFYCEKGNHYKWLTIADTDHKIMVTLTNDVGLIIQRDYWNIYLETCLLQSEENIII